MSSDKNSTTLFTKPTASKDNEEMYFEDTPLPKLEISNPGKLLQLCETLTDNVTKALEMKLNIYLKQETQAKKVFFINIFHTSEEAEVQVVQEDILDPSYRIGVSEEIINKIVGYSNEVLVCKDLDPLFLQLIKGVICSPNIGDLMVVPIVGKARTGMECSEKSRLVPYYLICIIKPRKDNAFVMRLVNETLRFCKTLLINTRECEEERRLKKQCQTLLLVARKLFSRLTDVNDLLKEIMSEARRLTNAERCSLFLMDPDHMHLVAKVFDGVSSSDDTEVRIAKDQGIAGHVAATGQILNIKDAYKHPLFYKGMDEATGFKTRNILCFPIKDEDNIVGVAQLCNKVRGTFDYFDEQVANAFSIYCGISIVHSLIYKRIQDAQARSKLSNELMMYHMQVSDQDVANVLLCSNPHFIENFDKFSYAPRGIILKETPCFVLKMFKDLGFIQTFSIKMDVLTRFILYVKKGYRELPYHNWMHAFSVAHFSYLCLKNFKMIENGYLSKLEAMALFVSCLCHDIDHRGTTNAFQQQSGSVLASLYSSEGSVMERHHLSQTLATLNTEGCNFLDSLNRQDYTYCLDLIKDMILATDLANHYKIHAKQLIMSKEGYNKDQPEHKYYLASLLMTCADLSDQTKEWTECRKVAQQIYAEFFTQGDLEKKMGRKPINMMDREKAAIPDHQLDFLKEVCICIFKLLSTLFPAGKELVDAIKRNILCWESSKPIFNLVNTDEKTSYEVLASDELLLEVQMKMQALERS